MTAEKDLLERRVVMPLAQSQLADRFGVVPPRAIVLFGPPGTGKTTFAKAIASRLEWSFVEVFPSRLASHPGGLAGALRETFTTISELEHAVVFIDEVEEIASHRQGEPPSPTQGVTNELLKIIPAFREQPGRLLICATNFIRSLDAAFLRHGRFDYVIPIGLPGRAGARRDLATIHPGRSGRHRSAGARRDDRGLLAGRHRVRRTQGLAVGARERRLRRRGRSRGTIHRGLCRRDLGHPRDGLRRGRRASSGRTSRMSDDSSVRVGGSELD